MFHTMCTVAAKQKVVKHAAGLCAAGTKKTAGPRRERSSELKGDPVDRETGQGVAGL